MISKHTLGGGFVAWQSVSAYDTYPNIVAIIREETREQPAYKAMMSFGIFGHQDYGIRSPAIKAVRA